MRCEKPSLNAYFIKIIGFLLDFCIFYDIEMDETKVEAI
jgi:hypothetical protein